MPQTIFASRSKAIVGEHVEQSLFGSVDFAQFADVILAFV